MINSLKIWIVALALPILLTLGASSGASAAVVANNLFKTRCVLQRDKPVNIWGTGNSGEAVNVTFTRGATSQTKSTVTGADGKWLVVLDPISGSYTEGTLMINSTTITNVLVGEVYLASGQSNMQYNFSDAGAPPKPAVNTNIRSFRIRTTYSQTPLTNYPWDIGWGTATDYMSQVAYYFMSQLQQDLGVPVGWISAPYSGTPIRTWISTPALQSTPLGASIVANYTGAQNQGAPSLCFNAMINPAFPYTVRGIIWYQGENDVNAAANYQILFPLLINSWRASFGQGNIPFYYVQLAGFNTPDGSWAGVREAQSQALGLSNTGMVVTLDIGNPQYIHPGDKDIVGQRLALLAKRRTYGLTSVVDEGPKFDHVEFTTDGKARVFFNNVQGGLTGDANLKGFTLAGTNGVYSGATSAVIEAGGSTVLVSSTTVTAPQFIRYAWENRNLGITLRNGAGLPAAPFRATMTEPRGTATGRLTNFRWGSGTQTGAGALGAAGDPWMSSTVSQVPATTPVALFNTVGVPTGVTASWLTGTGGQPGYLATNQTSQYWSPYNAATATLMSNYLYAYHYTNNTGAIQLSINGLTPNFSYDLVLYAASLNPGTTNFNITGATVTSASTTGATRRISDGPGVAYVTKTVTSSATGTLTVRTANSGSYVRLNGFQLSTP